MLCQAVLLMGDLRRLCLCHTVLSHRLVDTENTNRNNSDGDDDDDDCASHSKRPRQVVAVDIVIGAPS